MEVSRALYSHRRRTQGIVEYVNKAFGRPAEPGHGCQGVETFQSLPSLTTSMVPSRSVR